jgi:hypothetical protein
LPGVGKRGIRLEATPLDCNRGPRVALGLTLKTSTPSPPWVPLDKSEGVVKGIVFLCGAKHRWSLPERLKDQDSGISP